MNRQFGDKVVVVNHSGIEKFVGKVTGVTGSGSGGATHYDVTELDRPYARINGIPVHVVQDLK